jgi:hypothetical protein
LNGTHLHDDLHEEREEVKIPSSLKALFSERRRCETKNEGTNLNERSNNNGPNSLVGLLANVEDITGALVVLGMMHAAGAGECGPHRLQSIMVEENDCPRRLYLNRAH